MRWGEGWLGLDVLRAACSACQRTSLSRPPNYWSPYSKGQAAIIIPLIHDNGHPGVLLTKRSQSLRKHAGQIAFPGGMIDLERVETAQEAALRELEEEVRLPANLTITLVGPLGCYPNRPSQLRVWPFVAILDSPAGHHWEPASAGEVDQVFSMGLGELRKPAGWTVIQPGWPPMPHYESAACGRVWGMTAYILHDFLAKIPHF